MPPVRLLSAVVAVAFLVGGSLLRWVSTGLGVVAIMAGVAIVLSCVSLLMSGNNARRLTALNKQPPDTDTAEE